MGQKHTKARYGAYGIYKRFCTRFSFWRFMPSINDYDNREDWMGVCIPKLVEEGKEQDQATAACSSMWENKTDAMKYRSMT